MAYIEREYHWKSRTREYNIWQWILQRCYNNKNTLYKHYWARWIKCKWNKFSDFWNDMKDTYEDWLTIERDNVNEDYCKSNCSWATVQQQNINKRNTLRYKWKLIIDWCIELWIKRPTLYSRLRRWKTIEQALWLM